MSNKLNGLTLNQAELLLVGLRSLDRTSHTRRDKTDRKYLIDQLDTIINDYLDELDNEYNNKDNTNETK